MPLTLSWADVAQRLFFAVLAGAPIGWNRGEHGHPAGLRTTLLVCLAATLWFVTVIGLCLGGGQLGVGIVATVLGYVVLTLLDWLEDCCRPIIWRWSS